jgi:hypothetical protein
MQLFGGLNSFVSCAIHRFVDDIELRRDQKTGIRHLTSEKDSYQMLWKKIASSSNAKLYGRDYLDLGVRWEVM